MSIRKNRAAKTADDMLNDDTDVTPEEPETDEGDDDEGEPDPEPSDPDVIPVDRPSRRERRQDRLRESIANDVTDRVSRVLNERLASLQQVQPQQRQEPVQQRDEMGERIDGRLKAIYEEQNSIHKAFAAQQKAGTLTDAEYERQVTRARQLDEEKSELLAVRANRKYGFGRQQDPEAAAREAIAAQNRAKHADVYGHPQADALVQYAEGYFQSAVARAKRMGQPVNGPELLEQALDKAREEWGMQTRSPSRRERSEVERRKFTAAPTSGGKGPGRTITMTRETRAMADAAFGHIKDPAKRYAHWAKTAGKRIVSGE